MNGSEENSTDSISKNRNVLMASSGKGKECHVASVDAETVTVAEKAGKIC